MPQVATAQALDAYKNYLLRAGRYLTVPVDGMQQGLPIPVHELEMEIASVTKTIQTCKTLGIQTVEEENKLKGLNALLNSVKGKLWPTTEQIFQEFTAEHEAQKKIHQMLKAKTALDKLKYINKAAPTQVSIPSKIQPKQGVASKLFIADGIKIEQEFIMRVGVASNCNVSIMTVYRGTRADGVSVYCKVCAVTKILSEAWRLTGAHELTDEVELYCKAHRHERAVPEAAASGRYIRADDE